MKDVFGKLKRSGAVRANRIAALVILVALLLTGVAYAWLQVSDYITGLNLKTLDEMAANNVTTAMNAVSKRWEMLENIGSYIGRQPPSSVKEMIDMLSDTSGNIADCNFLAVIDTDGVSYTSKNRIAPDASVNAAAGGAGRRFAAKYDVNSFALEELQRQLLVIGIRIDPVKVGDAVIDTLYGTVRIDAIRDELRLDLFGGRGFSSIIERDGTYLANIGAAESFLAKTSIFERMELRNAVIDGYGSVGELREAVASLGDGKLDVTCRLDGETYYIVFNGVRETDWCAVTAVPGSVFSEQTGRILSIFIIAAALILAAAGAAYVLLVRSSRAERRLILEQENNARVLMLTDNFEALYDVDLQTGSYEVYSKGRTYSEKVRTELVEDRDFFEDLAENVAHVVYPADRKGFMNTISAGSIRSMLERDACFDWYYRLVMDGRPVWYRLRVLYKDENRRNVIMGVFNAAREMAEREQNDNLRKEIIERMMDGESVYLVNPETDRFRTLHRNRYLSEQRGDDEPFTQYLERYIRSGVHANDRGMMLASSDIRAISRRLDSEKEVSLEYRDVTSGTSRWFRMRAAKISGTEIIVGFADVDDEYIRRAIGEKIEGEYFAMFSVDLDSGMLRIIKKSPWDARWQEGAVAPYTEVIDSIAGRQSGEAKDFYGYLRSTENVKRLLEAEGKFSFSYPTAFVENRKWVTLTGRTVVENPDGSPEAVALGFMLMDNLGSESRRLQRELETALAAAEVANRSKTSFLFNMSHDIRTPMNAITGFTAMAKKYAGDRERVLEYLDKIEISGSQLLSLINQVLEMSRIESGRIEFEEKPVDIRERYEAMITVFAAQAETKGLRFIHSLRNVRHGRVIADDARMGQITLNIVGNAMKYTPEGGTVEYILEEVEPRREGFATFTFTVADTGIGMSSEFMEHLFEPFSREKTSTVSHIQGTGLGMSIVKSILNLLGGTIEVQSAPGAGTRFDITVDFRIDETAQAEEEDMPEPDAGSVSFEGRRVLVVEDNEMNREIATDILEEQGLEVETAEDGDVAVEMVRKAVSRGDSGYYDFILMDVQMPRMNGYEATKAIRAIPVPEGVHIPIIAMTANAFEEDRQDAFAAGMDEHLAKPIDVQKAFRTIARFLK